MKIIKNKPQLFLLTLLCLGVAAIFTSCSKGNDNNDTPVAHIRVVNALEGSAAQDFYLDGTKVNASAVAYAQNTDNISVLGGNHAAKFTDSGSATANVSFSLSLLPANYYTVYYTGSDTSKSFFVTQNDITLIPSEARVRFVQLSQAAAAAVDFGIAGSSKLVTSLGYKVASAYYNVNANTTFALYAAGSNTVLLNIPTTVQSGTNYTIYISGSTALTLSAHVIAEN